MPRSPHIQHTARSLRVEQTNSALQGLVPESSLVYVSAPRWRRWLQLPVGWQASTLRRASCQLVLLGLLLGLCFWLLFPLPGEALPVTHALVASFPWLPYLFWTNQFPFMAALVSRVSWLSLRPGSPATAANLLLLVLGLAFFLLFLAARACQRVTRSRLSKKSMRFLLALLCLFTLLFGVLFMFRPDTVSQATLLLGVYGRLMVMEHLNPYLVVHVSSLLSHDPLYRALPPGSFVSPQAGPFWLDLTVPLAWLTQGSPALALLVFRAFGLCLHLLNVLLLWGVLAKLRPEARLVGTLLYAWNPAFLLLGVGEMQADLAVIFCLLLGVCLLQRHSLLPGWTFVLLAALINPLVLLLLPLFLRVLARDLRGRSVFWWGALLLVSALIVLLASAPYWPDLGIAGLALRLGTTLWPDVAWDSLLTALNGLPFASLPVAAWLLSPQHWMVLPALIVGPLVLLGIWIADTLELALLLGCWIFLALAMLWPINTPWLILLPLALSLTGSSRRTAVLTHLLTSGSLVAYCLAYWPVRWDGQALVTLGLPALIWGWMLFFTSTWQMTHRADDKMVLPPQQRKRLSLSRPSWPPRTRLKYSTSPTKGRSG